MNSWNKRTREVAYLLNPAFCGRMLYSAINAYSIKTKRAFPFPLVYLVLPLVLHKETRANINSRTQLHLWVQQHPTERALSVIDEVQTVCEKTEALLLQGMSESEQNLFMDFLIQAGRNITSELHIEKKGEEFND